ncbi:MAG: cellulase family glycosylhydrolase [Tetrasphaera sp.]
MGHAGDAKAWGWNAVRLNFLVSGVIDWSYVAQNGYPDLLRQLDSIVAEYTAKGIVVMLDAHDDPATPTAPTTTGSPPT